MIALMVPLTGLFARLRRHRRGEARDDVLLLLALLLALRCLLDPWDISYYALPFLLALLTWEVSRSTGAPVVTVVATLVTCFIVQETGSPLLHLSRDAQAAIFLLVSVPSIVGLAVAAYVPQVGEGLLARSQRLLAAAAPAPASS